MDPYFQSDDIKLTDFLRGVKNYSLYILKRIYIVILATVFMYYAGRWFAYLSKKEWVANVSFNAIDAQGGGGFGGLMSLASSFMGVGGGTSNDVLSGVFSSRTTIKATFLEEREVNGKTDKLGNHFLEALGYMDEYKKTPGMEDFKFRASDLYKMNYLEDSVMAELYLLFTDDYLEVEYDPLTGLIKAGVSSPVKELSTEVCEVMIRNTKKYYSSRNYEKALESYNKLKTRVDSIKSAMRYYDNLSAKLLDQNVFNQKQEGVVDKDDIARQTTILSIQYNDAVSSLEAAKSVLNAESDVIRIVDQPAFSTELDYRDPDFWGLIGLAVGAGLSILILCLVKASKDSFEEERQEQEKTNTSFS
ncbi:MAG: hypothetical protein M9887_09735 [Chitinophagales bacterium]|nr:hypothetical protein [Chitinophagales bacterium]